jgi:phosphohistidine phosphatase
MKTLLLLRHAKSSWDEAGIADFERPLAPRGRKDAPRMGKTLAKRGPVPDAVVSSPAERARQTVEAFLVAAGLELQPKFDEKIYAASSETLVDVVRRLPPRRSCVLLVGHNPGFEELLARLTGSPAEMPTAALACIDFETRAWSEIRDGGGTLRWLLAPKELG